MIKIALYRCSERRDSMKEILLPARVENIDVVTDFVNEQLQELDCPVKAQIQIDVAIDELFGNIARYAYDNDEGEAIVRVESGDEGNSVTITFIDGGKPFDPLKRDDPDVTLSAAQRNIGGLGIFVVKRTMDDVSYKFENGKNILSIHKKLGR